MAGKSPSTSPWCGCAKVAKVFLLVPQLLPWLTSCRLSEDAFHQDCASHWAGNDSDLFHWLQCSLIEEVTRVQNTAVSVKRNFYWPTDLPALLPLRRERDKYQISAPSFRLHPGHYSLADRDGIWIHGQRSCCMLCFRWFSSVICGAPSIDET